MTGPSVPSSQPPGPDDESVAADEPISPEHDEVRRARRRRVTGFVLAGLVAVAIVAAAFLIPLPYYLIEPGGVRPAEQRIEIEGAESYDSEGEVMFTTIFITRATPALMVKAWLDDAIEIRTPEEAYPTGDTEETREENFRRMDLSKLNATLVALDTVGLEATLTGDGVRVLGIIDDAPSGKVLRPGDVIVAVDGVPVHLPLDIAGALAGRAPGDVVELELVRGEENLRVKVELSEAVTDPGRAALGIHADVADPRVESDVEVLVDSGDVSGPSAGLAWTLAIIDRLTPGSLTGDRDIAVTGEMRPDGTVGPIGGLPQKVAAVKRAGIDLFLYPASTPEAEQEQMRRIAGDDVELYPVASIDDAVEVLVPGGLKIPA